MRIAVIASWYPTPEAPVVGAFVRHQAEELARHHDVAVVAPRFVPWRPFLAGRWGARQTIESDGRLTVIRPRWCQPLPRLPFAWALASAAWAAESAFATLLGRWGSPDLLHAHVALPGGYAAVKIGKKHALPVFLTEHTGPLKELMLQTAFRRKAVRDTLRGCDRVIAVSPEMERQIREFDPSVSVTVIPNLLRTRFFDLAPDQVSSGDPVRFFLVGLLAERKGGRYLIEAAELLLKRDCTRFRVVIGGDGEARPSWETMVAEKRVQSHVHFLGRLTDEEVRRQMQLCDVFVLPSLHENFGIVAAEAMACGKPVLATRCGGGEYVVTPETGVLVPPADAAALAEGMAGFIAARARFDPRQVRRTVVERFGEDVFLQSLNRVYGEALDARRCAAPIHKSRVPS